jgi:hypothetical protein
MGMGMADMFCVAYSFYDMTRHETTYTACMCFALRSRGLGPGAWDVGVGFGLLHPRSCVK